MADSQIIEKLRSGLVIPAHPLALRADNNIDERRQRALHRYYLDCGAGGLALGVHTTQFAIHDPKIGLYRPVLELAMQTAKESLSSTDSAKPVMIAGVLGDTSQAVEEANLARDLGYDMGLLSLTALKGRPIDEFWQKFVDIPNVVAIKIAPFNRYQSLDVLEALAHSGRAGEIALYTGNDDNIIIDLLTTHEFNISGKPVSLQIVGGLLGQWACWTKRAVEQLARIKEIRQSGAAVPQDLLTLAGQMTLANKAIFDADNSFAGCIPGISYILKRQGLVKHVETLDPNERLSPGQAEKIDSIIRNYPHLTDDDFVTENLDKWLS